MQGAKRKRRLRAGDKITHSTYGDGVLHFVCSEGCCVEVKFDKDKGQITNGLELRDLSPRLDRIQLEFPFMEEAKQ